MPFYGAVFWGSVLAIIFAPFYRRLLAVMDQRRNLAALTTLLLCLIIVILPLTLIMASLLKEGLAVYQRIRSGELNFGAYFQQIMDARPPWMVNLMERSGIGNLSELRDALSNSALQGSQLIATQALSIGQNTFEFIVSFAIMLYLLFFLLRDGAALTAKISQAIPLSLDYKHHLFSKFTTVVRAAVKGNIAVAAAQGMLGGLIFWFLGIEGALVGGFVTGAIWQGIVLILFGVLVIGLVDNLLRPILVGKTTQLPDYVILISTLGGMVLFGLNGFVIGPVIAAMFIAAWDLFATANNSNGS
jgi:predicted PurR-regulated permease PerM